MPLPPAKKQDPGLHMGNADSQTLDSGLLPKRVDSYVLGDTGHIWGFNKAPVSFKLSPLHKQGGADFGNGQYNRQASKAVQRI